MSNTSTLEVRVIDNLGRDKTPILDKEIEDLQNFMNRVLRESNKGTYSDRTIESIPYELRQDRMMHTFAVIVYTNEQAGDRKIVGSGFLNDWKPGGYEGGRWEVRCMYIDHVCQRIGLGSRILKELEEKAKRIGMETLDLEAVNLPGTVQFYKKNGWVTTNEYEKEIEEERVRLTHMSKSLKG